MEMNLATFLVILAVLALVVGNSAIWYYLGCLDERKAHR